jgi:hypothetical protein
VGTTRNQYFNLVLALAVGLTILGRSAAADSKIGPGIAVNVYNYARVNQETLANVPIIPWWFSQELIFLRPLEKGDLKAAAANDDTGVEITKPPRHR